MGVVDEEIAIAAIKQYYFVLVERCYPNTLLATLLQHVYSSRELSGQVTQIDLAHRGLEIPH